MKSKQELTQVITRWGGERRQYLNDFFENCPDDLVHSTRGFPEARGSCRQEWTAAMSGGSSKERSA